MYIIVYNYLENRIKKEVEKMVKTSNYTKYDSVKKDKEDYENIKLDFLQHKLPPSKLFVKYFSIFSSGNTTDLQHLKGIILGTDKKMLKTFSLYQQYVEVKEGISQDKSFAQIGKELGFTREYIRVIFSNLPKDFVEQHSFKQKMNQRRYLIATLYNENNEITIDEIVQNHNISRTLVQKELASLRENMATEGNVNL